MYGLYFVEGRFGSGKTKNTFLQAYKMKKKYGNNIVVIANVPYSFVDIFYNSNSDFKKLFSYLLQYMQDTNGLDYLKITNNFKKVIFVLDESHLYLYSRNFKDNLDLTNLLVLTQLRKRNIIIPVISQRFFQVDKNIRALSNYVVEYRKSFFGLIVFEYFKEILSTENVDIYSEQNRGKTWELLSRSFFFPFFQNFFNSDFLQEKYLTNYIVGFNSVLNDFTYEDFLDKLYINDER